MLKISLSHPLDLGFDGSVRGSSSSRRFVCFAARRRAGAPAAEAHGAEARTAKKSSAWKCITKSTVSGCPARCHWLSENEAKLAMPKYVAVVEAPGKAGRKRSAAGDEGGVEDGGEDGDELDATMAELLG